MEESGVVTLVVTIVALLLIAAAAAVGLKRTAVPYTVGLVLIGLGLGFAATRVSAFAPLQEVVLSPDLILFVFLPTLIFESAFSLDSRLLSRNLVPVMVLAAPGLLLSTAVVGGLVWWLTPLALGPALVFGALISATDPVAVIALFKELGAPKRLAILVEGESLFNDATAIVLFRIILTVVAAGGLSLATVARGGADFLFVFVGGLLVGAVIGYLMIRSIALAGDEPVVQVALSTVVAYAAFIAAEHYLHVSGVMATLAAGVVVGSLGATRFSGAVRSYLHQFWEYAAFVANSLIFLLVGLSVTIGDLLADLGPIAWALVAVLVARAAVVFGLVPVIERLPGAEPIDGRYRIVLAWGGLRGAVALALALSLPHDFAQRDLIAVFAVAVVLFTLLTGGITMRPIMHALGLDRPTLVEQIARAQADVAAKREALARVGQLATAGHFSSRLTAEVMRDRTAARNESEEALRVLRSTLSRDDLRLVLWSEAATVERAVYRDLFDRSVISESVLRELELATDLVHDSLKRGVVPHEVGIGTPLEARVVAALVRALERLAPRAAPRARVVQRYHLRALAARYEHDMAVHEAGRRVGNQIAELAELAGAKGDAADECRAAYERRAREALQHLDSVAEHFPEYVQAVQRHTAQRMALDGEVDAVDRLASTGAIPAAVARETRRALDAAQHDLMRHPVVALVPKPEDLLVRVPLMAGLGPADLASVAGTLVPRTILAGTAIIRQDEKGSSLYLIARGVVAVLVARGGGEPDRVASLGAGEFFGERALLTAEPRNATVQAVTDCQLYELMKRDVDALRAGHPELERTLLAADRAR